ncbi:ABC transporter ATP-binding protein [Acetobacter tropicalis]|uniref:ABC transporter ATP-binding protein n=1 Tax=Acetobacter tropicalis TaxID=104102 RepID=UPI00068F92BB|nr:ABC transporter ATP-binding protein [Acetobacter tropicalis]KAA8389924.1 ABC transporter ATP-binding protein [Acetobacter tropicalis]KAA8392977.1 ABC transporter ATP-binding protein [Acetobacter tropicalis]MBC9008024.1 ABC transporter ATP-binding protein [Acetobacter tropicalis]MDO8172638.1 ABC transporter ATP-binding protein [Acetobacter tropicalis]
MSEPVFPLEITHLVKEFSTKRALDGFNLTLAEGEIAALLGPNGAGKTTLIGCLLGFLSADAGQIRLFGEDVNHLTSQVRNRIGFVPQTLTGFTWFKVGELLSYLAGYRPANTPQDNRWLEWAALDPAARIKSLSGGERQRLAIVLALRFRPDLIVLDEPVASLDPQARHDFMRLLPDYAHQHGATVLISSHIISDLENICDRFVIMRRGQIVLDVSEAVLQGQVRHLSAVPPDEWGVRVLAPAEDGGVWVDGWQPVLDQAAAGQGLDVALPDVETLFLALSR